VPNGISRLAFSLWYRRRNLCVTATPGEAVYELKEGEPLTFRHYGEPALATADAPVKLPIPPVAARPRPRQPPGREPARRIPPGID
jgi:alpha,alpha-trehalose phosphorylase